MYVKQPDFGDLKGLVVQIDGIAYRIQGFVLLRQGHRFNCFKCLLRRFLTIVPAVLLYIFI